MDCDKWALRSGRSFVKGLSARPSNMSYVSALESDSSTFCYASFEDGNTVARFLIIYEVLARTIPRK